MIMSEIDKKILRDLLVRNGINGTMCNIQAMLRELGNEKNNAYWHRLADNIGKVVEWSEER